MPGSLARYKRTATPMAITKTLELLGVPCPLNWARTKVVLEGMAFGERLRVLVDDPRAERDLPAAAEASGHAVVEAQRDPRGLWITIER